MSPTDRALFLSLRPAYAELILSGKKTVELRRIRPKAPPGTLVLVYACSPIQQVVGTCTVDDIGVAEPDEIWRLHGARTGICKAVFAAYFDGSDRGVAITVRAPRRMRVPIPLEVLRRQLAGFVAPQSFRYIAAAEAELLIPREWDTHLEARGTVLSEGCRKASWVRREVLDEPVVTLDRAVL